MHVRRPVFLCLRRVRYASIEVISPRDGAPFATLHDWTASDVDSAIESGRRHLASGWAGRDDLAIERRCGVLRCIGAALRTRTEEFAQLESRDCGKPIAESRVDLEMCAALFDYYAEIAPRSLAEQPLALPDESFHARVVPHPIGLVGAVTPWNYPLMQAIVKVAPALAVGCAVLLKPSPLASLSCVLLGELATDAGLPRGALAVVTGGPPGGVADGAAALVRARTAAGLLHLARSPHFARTTGTDSLTALQVRHPRLDYLSFTGSGAAGRALLHASADALRPSALELGGKGAMLVFDDCDIDAVVDWAMVGIFSCAGQACACACSFPSLACKTCRTTSRHPTTADLHC